MSKKKKTVHTLSVQELEHQATQQFVDGDYKGAIDSYKQLLKQEEREEWRKDLATAYLERAKSLANKEMYKEASVLWENRATLCQDQTGLDWYILWLIRGGRYIRAARLYSESLTQLADSDLQPQLLTWFALLMLTNTEEIKEFFPAETTVYQQYQTAHSALQAYCQSDDVRADSYLKQISFRSPYRDFRFILKALMLFDRDQAGTHQALTQVPAHSPFFRLAQLIQATVNFDEKLWERLLEASPHEQALLTCLKGWDKAQLKTILSLHLAAKKANSKTLFGTILAHRHLLGEQYSQKFCLALLPDYIGGLKDYQKTFGKLSPFEQERMSALAEERQRHFKLAERHWRKCIDLLKQNAKEGDNAVKIALIFRRLFSMSKHESDCSHLLKDLEESLFFDPSDKASYMELINAYKEEENDKHYQKWVDAAIAQFPKDTEILMAAIASARHRKAFKKATKLANALLQIDPINIKARQILLSSHLAHTYKLIKGGKFELARRELALAHDLERENQRSGLLPIIRGLLEWQEGLQDVAVRFFVEGIEQAGGNLKGYLYLLVETMRLKMEVEPILTVLPLLKKPKPEVLFSKKIKFPLPQRHDVLEVIGVLNAYQEEGINFLPKVLESLASSLEKVNCQDFSQDELIRICQCFEKIGTHSLLKKYADEALKRWPKSPIFIYYRVYAKTEGLRLKISDADVESLEGALEQSHRDGDKRAAMLIADFLMQSFKDEMRDLRNVLDDQDEVDKDELEELLEQLRKAGLDLPEPKPRKK